MISILSPKLEYITLSISKLFKDWALLKFMKNIFRGLVTSKILDASHSLNLCMAPMSEDCSQRLIMIIILEKL